MKFRELFGKKLLFFDGGMGTMLQAAGLEGGEIPEYWNMTKPEVIIDIHYQYLMAGANIVETNAFGANPIKMPQDVYSSYDLMFKSVELAKLGIEKCKLETGREDLFVAATLGPIGSLLKPLGSVSFDEAYDSFKILVEAANDACADLILIETMTDTYEIKAAILAAKENSDLPIIASVMLDESGKLLTGGNIDVIAPLFEGLGVDGVGLNCGFGPKQLAEFVPQYLEKTSLPLMVNANAGLPKTSEDGSTLWDLSPEDFASEASKFANNGALLIGGCCGTTPEHIKALVLKSKNIVPPNLSPSSRTVVTSNSMCREINDDFTIIGEKINPTGNKVFKKALMDRNMYDISKLAIEQQNAGCHALDINVGLPGIDEVVMLTQVIEEVQNAVTLPLMIDTSNSEAMEKALRYYNGIPFINSVSGKSDSLKTILPLAAKYGGVLIALTLDDDGIPSTPEKRVEIALKIIDEASKYGIPSDNILIDPLTLTVSADPKAPLTTLETLRQLKALNIKTAIGVSNVSFGLPNRDNLTSTFLAMALSFGLTAGILNPFSSIMMDVCRSSRALMGFDINCEEYIKTVGRKQETLLAADEKLYSLKSSIINGLKGDAQEATIVLGEKNSPLEIVNEHIVPALNHVGDEYEKGGIYLPQLLMSAEAAQEAFGVIRSLIERDNKAESISKGKIILATVKGDVHDIGKNIVKVLLENYGYEIIDLGKDVSPETILERAIAENIHLVGLSALMTTTVPNMAATIQLLRENDLNCKVLVGGAVLSEDYAMKIGADFYCKDAMATVKYAESLDIL